MHLLHRHFGLNQIILFIVIPLAFFSSLFLFVDKSVQTSNTERRSQLDIFGDDRLIALQNIHSLEKESLELEKIYLSKRKSPEFITGIEGPVNIEQLHDHYMTILDDENSTESPFSKQSLNHSRGVKKVDSYPRSKLYFKDYLGYHYDDKWLFKLKVNNILFWVKEDDEKDDGIFRFRNSEETPIATFSVNYSF